MNSIKLPPQFDGLFKKKYTDVVGIELGSGLSGVPAVRLLKGKQGIEVKAIGILDLLDIMPQNPDAGPQEVAAWSLPKPFCAPHAALTVTSKLSFLRHTSGVNEEIPEKKKYLYRDIRRAFASDMPELVAGIPDFQADSRLAPDFPAGHHEQHVSASRSPEIRGFECRAFYWVNEYDAGRVSKSDSGIVP